MQVTVILSEKAAIRLHRRYAKRLIVENQGDEPLLSSLAQLGVDLQPTHPDIDEPLLLPYFQVEVPDEGTAQKVLEQLKKSVEVEAAYVKPADELP